MLSKEKVSLLSDLSKTVTLPITLTSQADIIHTFNPSQPNPIFRSLLKHYKACQLFTRERKLVETPYFERFLILPLSNKEWLIVGPSLQFWPSQNSINSLLQTENCKESLNTFSDYLLTLSIRTRDQLIHAGKLAYYILFNETINLFDDLQNEDRNLGLQTPDHIKSIEHIRQHTLYHQDPVVERKVFQLIEDGNTAEIIPFFKSYTEKFGYKFGILSKRSEIRNLKNLMIATITLATRAAIRGGLHPEDAYTLGDALIRELEDIYNIQQLKWLEEDALLTFTKMVAKTKQQHYSKKITICQEIIYKHIYNPDLKVAWIADQMKINKKYLSHLFKKEVGISMSTSIQKSKIDEAKKLIIYKNSSLHDICTLLNFTDQSHFTKVFKKITQTTPSEFREKNRLI